MNLVRRTVVGKGIKVRLGQVENMIWLALSESSTTNEGKNSLIRQIKLEDNVGAGSAKSVAERLDICPGS